MADTDANVYGAGGATSAEALRPRSPASVRARVDTEGVPYRPRSLASVRGASTGTPRRFVMLAHRITSPVGPTSWVSTGAPDTSGASYPDGPSALDPATITVAGRG